MLAAVMEMPWGAVLAVAMVAVGVWIVRDVRRPRR